MTPELEETPIPPEMAARLPALPLLRAELLRNLATHQADQPLVRAAWNAASIWPLKVQRTYRFGPPADLANANGFPYHWVYIAEDTCTAAWEAQLCQNDVTRPGTFYIAHGAQQALIATLSFAAPLNLLDLTGLAASRLVSMINCTAPITAGANGWAGSWTRSSRRKIVRFTASCTRPAVSPANWPMRYPRAIWQRWEPAWHAHTCNSATLMHTCACLPITCAWSHPDQRRPTPARATCP